jgi:siroheme synthase-like protein
VSAHRYPILLDVRDRLVVIVGGGNVAARKAKGLFDAGATRVRCVSPAFNDKLPQAVERVVAEYDPSHLDGAGLVFAATNSGEVNDAVVRDALVRGILVNRADADDEVVDDFSSMAVHRSGAVMIGVSAAGNPGLATLVRDELATALDPAWGELANALATIRPLVLRSNVDPGARRKIFVKLASRDAVDVYRAGGVDGLLTWLRKDFPIL